MLISIYLKNFILLLVSWLIILELCDCCKITIKIRSETKKSFRIQIFIPSIKQKTEQVTFDGPEEKKIQIKGEDCLNKKWVIRTWKPDGHGDWIAAKQDSAKIDGNGWFKIVVNDELIPLMGPRLGIFCSEGMLCGG